MNNKDWTLFTGSKEQIDEIKNAQNGVIFLDKHINYGEWIFFPEENDLSNIDTTTLLAYFICEVHPYANVINIWRQTGQPIFIKCNIIGLEYSNHKRLNYGSFDGYFYYMSTNPNWKILGAEYSLRPYANILEHRYDNVRQALLKGK